MKAVGQAGSWKPRVRPGDFERALALMVEVGGDKGTRTYLSELVAASAAQDKAREEAEAATAKAKQRESEAQAAEAKAARARQALADQSAAAQAALAKREAAVSKREASADSRDTALFTQKRDIDRRVKLLTEAGVVLAE